MISNNRSGPPLQDLAVFASVAEAESFSGAARRLGVSKAMVSVAISRLEARLNVLLFQRTTRRLTLTEAGAAALPHAQRALSAARDAEEAATEALASPRGTLRINAPMSFGLLHVMPALSAFAQLHTEIKVDLVLDDRVLDLVQGGFDLAVRIGNLPDSSLVSWKLGQSRNVLAAHPDYLTRRGTPAHPDELRQHDALVYSLSPTAARWTLQRGASSLTVRVNGPLQTNSSLALQHALHAAWGIARIPLFVVGDDLASARLAQVLPGWHLPEQSIHALTTVREPLPRKTLAFIEFLRARINSPPYWERALPTL